MPARQRPLGEPPERGLGRPGLPAACGGLDQVGQHLSAEERGIVFINAERGLQRRLVVAQAELEHGQAILGEDALCTAAGAGRLAGDGSRDPARVRLATAPGQLVHLRDACRPDDARIPGGRGDLGSPRRSRPGRRRTGPPLPRRDALVVERYRQRGQRPMVAGELDPAAGQRVLGLVIE